MDVIHDQFASFENTTECLGVPFSILSSSLLGFIGIATISVHFGTLRLVNLEIRNCRDNIASCLISLDLLFNFLRSGPLQMPSLD